MAKQCQVAGIGAGSRRYYWSHNYSVDPATASQPFMGGAGLRTFLQNAAKVLQDVVAGLSTVCRRPKHPEPPLTSLLLVVSRVVSTFGNSRERHYRKCPGPQRAESVVTHQRPITSECA
jgi:hypothetical protein